MVTSKLIAIHQPNFFPWLGYFNKIVRADVFFFLDDVQFPKGGNHWMNRVKMLKGGHPKWFTVRLNRKFSGTLPINEMTFALDHRWREELLNLLEQNYGFHPFYEESMTLVTALLGHNCSNLAEFNMYCVETILNHMGFWDCDLRVSSDLKQVLSGTERLCAIVTYANGTRYLAGGGASSYQNDEIFSRCNIGVEYQNFVHPQYTQMGSTKFESGLSILDALMNTGKRRTREIVLGKTDDI